MAGILSLMGGTNRVSPPDFGTPPALPAQEDKPNEGLTPTESPILPTGPGLRDFEDIPETRRLIFDNVLNAASTLQPMEDNRHRLSLSDVHYADDGFKSKSDYKKAVLAGSTLGRRLKGTWVLADKATGAELGRKTATLANVPYLTDGGTFVKNGTEYAVRSQLRLQPGAYTRRKENGEVETHVAVKAGQGAVHRYFLDPDKGTFSVLVGQAKIPLISLLRVMGASDDQLKDAWGKELYAANAKAGSGADLDKLYQRFLRNKTATNDLEKREQLKGELERTELDDYVSKRTLGKPYKNLSLDAILDATRKLIAVNRGEAEVDDRDNLAFQTVHGPEDFFAERIAKDYGGLLRKQFRTASWSQNINKIPPGALTGHLESVLVGSGLALNPEESNPTEVLDKLYAVTRMGEGGIPSVDSVPDEARSVQPSHFGYIDPVRTPESLRAGVDVYFGRKTKKGSDGRVYSPWKNARTGKIEYKSPQDIADVAVTFPGMLQQPGKRVYAMQNGRIRLVKKKDVEYVLPNFENAFSPLGNLIPAKSMSKPQRMAMGSRMLTQALPLIGAEAPLVRGASDPDETGNRPSFEEIYGKQAGAIRADKGGQVVAVQPGEMKVRYDDGTTDTVELFNNHPLNRRTYFHQTPVLQPGQKFTKGSLLARSNYTDDKGVLAMGRNARTAYISFRGLNHEDAIVISKSFADKLSSEHLYQHRAEYAGEDKKSRAEYMGLFPSRFSRKQLDTIDDNGWVKPGTILQQGDPIILHASPRSEGAHKVHKKGARPFEDHTQVWDYSSPAEVTDVVPGKNGVVVLTKSVMPMQVADKLSGFYGDKGTVSGIIPDDDMPRDKEGRPFEVLLNPAGLISRTNASQIVAASLGKIAAKTGKPYIIPDFDNIDDLTEWTLDELKKHNMTSDEDIFDPATGRKIPGVLVGNRFIMKLHHQAESKLQGRSIGGYSAEGQPSKGGASGSSKRMALMDTNALLSHGSSAVLRDTKLIRGQKNEDYWLAFMQGQNPPKPKVPMVYEKFIDELKGAGINVIPDGGQLHLMALTDKDIDQLAGDREIKSGETVDISRGLAPIKNGLFDQALTGSHHGNRWSFIRLSEPMPNPVMEDPIRHMLGLTQKKYEAVLSGQEELNGEKGPEAISKALSSIDVPKALAAARHKVKFGRKTERDLAVRQLNYLKSAQRLGINPGDWVLHKVPVIPPRFRPISIMEGSGTPLVADANYLYRELIEANNVLGDLGGKVDDVSEERLALYNAFKAVTGLGDPVHPKLQEKRISGFLKKVLGSSPKISYLQRKLISTPVDTVGRAVITPNPELDMDHVSVPEDMAWSVYKPFVARRLTKSGVPLSEALKQIEERKPQAHKMLLEEMSQRPVIINRAPVLHRFGILAAWPKLTKDNSLQLSPLVYSGFGADNDGDQMNLHVPALNDAVQEAIDLMMPSRNLLSPSDFHKPMHMPSQEFVGGLYDATKPPDTKNGQNIRYFPTQADAERAYSRGEINIDTPIRILRP